MIPLNDLLNIGDPENYKLHLACWNGRSQPLDKFVADPAYWLGWNEWRGGRNDWTRARVLSFMDFYPRSDSWLFGGAFEVVERRADGYTLVPIQDFEKYVGRLLASFRRYQGMRGRAFRLEPYLDSFSVAEIFPSVYTGESFPGYENIEHDFGMLEAVFLNKREDWKAALSNMKGVYLIVDKSNGMKYVGSAYGDFGLWSRWACYIGIAHGWNDELVTLIKREGHDYARENFRFSLLEVMVKSTPDGVVLAREAHWKRVLLSREHGYNKN